MRKVRSNLRRLSPLLAILALLLALPGLTPEAGSAQAAPARQAGPKLVLAFYYMWYSPEVFATAQMVDHPSAPYTSASPATIDRQVSEAKGAGIDAFITSWDGIDTGSDGTFRTLLDRAAARGFKATIYFETNSVMQQGDVAGQLQAMLARYANHPAFLHWNGKPVVFFWSPQALGGVDAWRGVRQKVDPGNTQLWSVDTTDRSYLDVFDSVHLYSGGKWDNSTSVAQVDTQWRGIIDTYNKAHGTGRLWTAGVIPGWDESHIQPPRPAAKVFPRANGAMYEADWKAAIASNPDWITITSYNEWFEGTQIEPSASYGTRYLDLTRQYAGLWKNGPSPCDGGTYFQPTGKSICRKMESFWQQYGGIAQFGDPISSWISEVSPTDGKTYTVQYFERARFEFHPENHPPNDVLLSLLGLAGYRAKYPSGAPAQKANTDAGHLFTETGHWVGGAFWQYWQSHGGLFVNGYPVSDEFQEQGSDGKTYTVQYFERARFEFHPENQPPYNVLLGTLGQQAMSGNGGH